MLLLDAYGAHISCEFFSCLRRFLVPIISNIPITFLPSPFTCTITLTMENGGACIYLNILCKFVEIIVTIVYLH